MDDVTIGIALVVAGAAALTSGLIVGVRRSASKQATAEQPFGVEHHSDRRDEVEQNLSNMRRARDEMDI